MPTPFRPTITVHCDGREPQRFSTLPAAMRHVGKLPDGAKCHVTDHYSPTQTRIAWDSARPWIWNANKWIGKSLTEVR